MKVFRSGFVALLGCICFVSCASDSTTNSVGGRSLVGLVRDEPLHVGGESMPRTTADGTASNFTFVAKPGGLLAVYFGFTNCPDLCPTTLADIRSAFRRIGGGAEKVDVAMVTVDPERDTPEKFVSYLESFIADPIALRTTDEKLLKKVESAFLASSTVKKEPTGKVSVSHTAATYVVDDNGDVVVEWPFGIGADGMENDLKILIADLKGK